MNTLTKINNTPWVCLVHKLPVIIRRIKSGRHIGVIWAWNRTLMSPTNKYDSFNPDHLFILTNIKDNCLVGHFYKSKHKTIQMTSLPYSNKLWVKIFPIELVNEIARERAALTGGFC
jgi:hypothetical protein